MGSIQNPNLTEEQKAVLFQKQTEAPFSGELVHMDKAGEYRCANCDALLFDSRTKFDSGTGWPSFYDIAQNNAVTLVADETHGVQRTEVICATCGGHLGHVFRDAPDQPTGQRYCINSSSLCFKEKS
jgi:peptide-methionine (R)-S-oxide reductase